MYTRSRVLRLVALVFGLLASVGCSNGATEAPTITTPTPADGQKSASPPVESPEKATPDRPPRKPPSRRSGDDERLNPKIAGLGTDAMLAAFPERVGTWARASSNAHPAGTMGRWADGASASYQQGGREIRVDVTDMIRVSPCTADTWSTILEESLGADPASKRVVLGKHSAVLTPGSPGAEIGLWLGNRCQLGLSSANATGDELVALGSGLGLDALAAACERRDPAGVLGR